MNEEIRKAKYRGKLDLAGYKIPCYVLEDETRVLSGRGMQDALKMTDEAGKEAPGNRVDRFLSQKSLKPFIYKEKGVDHFAPIICYDGKNEIHGYEATRLVDFCDGVLEARKNIHLSPRQKIIAEQCEILVRSFAKVGIIALIDEATGYQAVREKTLQEILRLFISEEILKWQKTFHDGFYEQIFRLWGLPFTPEGIKKRPAFIGTLTNKLVYENLPEGVLEKIKEKNPKDKKGRWKYHFHRWLTLEVGREALKKVIYSVETLAKVSKNKKEFLRLVKKAYHPERDSPYFDTEAMEDEKETKFDKALEALTKIPPVKKTKTSK